MDYTFEYAKSNRAACKLCKDKIAKDALRIGTRFQVDKDRLAGAENASQIAHMMESTRWHHFQCFPRLKRTNWFADNLPEADACAGFGELRQEDQEKVAELFSHCRGLSAQPPEPPALPQAQSTPESKKGRPKRALEATDAGAQDPSEQASESVQKAPRLAEQCKTGGFTDGQHAEFEAHKVQLAKKSVAQLGVLLAKNGMPKTGKKDELVERVAECRVLGAPPTCPLCQQARLKWSRESGLYSCPGHFDEVAKRMVRCKGPPKAFAIERTPWEEAAQDTVKKPTPAAQGVLAVGSAAAPREDAASSISDTDLDDDSPPGESPAKPREGAASPSFGAAGAGGSGPQPGDGRGAPAAAQQKLLFFMGSTAKPIEDAAGTRLGAVGAGSGPRPDGSGAPAAEHIGEGPASQGPAPADGREVGLDGEAQAACDDEDVQDLGPDFVIEYLDSSCFDEDAAAAGPASTPAPVESMAAPGGNAAITAEPPPALALAGDVAALGGGAAVAKGPPPALDPAGGVALGGVENCLVH